MLKWLFANTITVGQLTIWCRGRLFGVFGKNTPGERPLNVGIHLADERALWKLVLNPDYELGELYMRGILQIEQGNLRELLELCWLNQAEFSRSRRSRMWRSLSRIWMRLTLGNTRLASRRNVAHHYDLSETLYRLFLDEDLQYSCAYFAAPGISLDAAQRAKKQHIATKLLLDKEQRLLDIGSGWGGLALSLARQGGGRVTGVTLSPEQLGVARTRAAEAGLSEHVEFRLQDYRDIQGKFDRIVSVGMFEHVGAKQYGTFFQSVARLLTEDGVALIHSIGHKDSPCPTNSWIRKYIFPGGYIPALSEVIPHIENAGLWITDIEILRLHYADTLHAWLERFNARRGLIKEIYDETFCRMWEFYLASCEMSFRHGGLMVFQLQLAKRIDAVPRTRDYIGDYENASQARHDADGWNRDILELPVSQQSTST